MSDGPSFAGGQLSRLAGGGGTGSFVPSSRTIFTTAPLRIDGFASADLSADRTLSVDFTANFTVVGTDLAINPVTPIDLNSAVAFRGHDGIAFRDLIKNDSGTVVAGNLLNELLIHAAAVLGIEFAVGLGNATFVFADDGSAGFGISTQAFVGTLGGSGALFENTRGINAVNAAASGTFEMLVSDADDRVHAGYAAGVLGTRGGRIIQTKHLVPADFPYNAQENDFYLGVTDTAAGRSIVLPAPATVPDGTAYEVKDESGNASGLNDIVISSAGGATIDGAATYRINNKYGFVRLVTNGVSWFTH